MRPEWRGILKVLEMQHVRNGQIITSLQAPLYNLLHKEAERYFLRCLFSNDGSLPPTNYYLGLDNREVITIDDEAVDIEEEPTINGYSRQAISSAASSEAWDITESANGYFKAVGKIITFNASGGSFGPVSNLFLIDKENVGAEDAVLLSSVNLSDSVTLDDGDALNLRISLSLRDYSQ